MNGGKNMDLGVCWKEHFTEIFDEEIRKKKDVDCKENFELACMLIRQIYPNVTPQVLALHDHIYFGDEEKEVLKCFEIFFEEYFKKR